MEKLGTEVLLHQQLLDELGTLKEQHGAFDRRLRELEQHISLTSEEQVEVAQLKKEKLRAKDRIAALSKKVAALHASGPSGVESPDTQH